MEFVVIIVEFIVFVGSVAIVAFVGSVAFVELVVVVVFAGSVVLVVELIFAAIMLDQSLEPDSFQNCALLELYVLK